MPAIAACMRYDEIVTAILYVYAVRVQAFTGRQALNIGYPAICTVTKSHAPAARVFMRKFDQETIPDYNTLRVATVRFTGVSDKRCKARIGQP